MEKYNLYYIIITLQCDIYYFLEYREMSINKIRFISVYVCYMTVNNTRTTTYIYARITVYCCMSFRNISKHWEELKIQGEAEYFLTSFEVFWNRRKSSLRVFERAS